VFKGVGAVASRFTGGDGAAIGNAIGAALIPAGAGTRGMLMSSKTCLRIERRSARSRVEQCGQSGDTTWCDLLMSDKNRLILQSIWGRLAEMRRSSIGSIAWSVDII
jgi:hypothetical protein